MTGLGFLRSLLLALVVSLGSSALAGSALADPMASPPDAKIFFVNLKDGDVVQSPVKIEFGISGMTVAKAGDNTPGTGHFHLLIDTKLTPADMTKIIPKDAQHVHFGGGQTETTQILSPGPHTLQLLLGDGNHMPHSPPVESAVITVTVK